MAASKITVICDRFHAIIITMLSKLLLESIGTANFTVNKDFCLHQKFIN